MSNLDIRFIRDQDAPSKIHRIATESETKRTACGIDIDSPILETEIRPAPGDWIVNHCLECFCERRVITKVTNRQTF